MAHSGNHRAKFPKLSKLFRSISEQGLKASPQASPKASPTGPPRRRFLRVVRDEESAGEEWENGNVVRRYTKTYWERQMREARELQHASSLPYDVNSEHGILKRNTSTESDCEAGSPTCNKRAYFKEEIQVFEFCGGESIQKNAVHTHHAKLYDSAEECGGGSVERSLDSDEHDVEFRRSERKQRADEFKLAKQLSFDEEDENVDNTDAAIDSPPCDDVSDATACDSGVASDVSLVSDSGAQSDSSSNCSDCDALNEPPKNKRPKKRRLRFRVSALLDTTNDSDKENDQQTNSNDRHARSSKSHSGYPKSIARLLRSVHLQRHKEQDLCSAAAATTTSATVSKSE